MKPVVIIAIAVVAMIGIMIPSTYAEEIPSWIKNNAGWWADGSIDDDSFIQGTQFLIKQGILQIEN